MLRILVCVLALLIPLAVPAGAETYQSVQARRPDLFDPDTGYRIARHRAPTPDNIPGPIAAITAEEVAQLAEDGAVLLDVFAATQSRFDELDGTWLVSKEHLSLPGATWLPETGRGSLEPAIARYLEDNLARLTGGDLDATVVVFCIADCWMSWNAAQRIHALGYRDVRWFRNGTDGWLDAGRALVPVDPVPVGVE